MTDPIADMLTQIRNAQAVGRLTVDVPFSKLKYGIAEILAKKGFIEKTEKRGRQTRKYIKITLKYLSSDLSAESSAKTEAKEGNNKTPAISGIERISKPGQRIYLPVSKIKRVKEGYGIAIISTSKGLMTNKEARKQKLGGEVICEIW